MVTNYTNLGNLTSNTSLTNATCFTPYSGTIDLTSIQISFLFWFNIIIGSGNATANGLVMLAIAKTKNFSSTATKFIFQLSFTDFLTAIITQPLYAYIFLFPINCTIHYIGQWIAVSLMHA